jgi:hypothetical protein
MSTKEKIAKSWRVAKQWALDIAEMDSDTYCTMRYKYGLAYLSEVCDAQNVEKLAVCPRFWLYWRNCWALRDFDFRRQYEANLEFFFENGEVAGIRFQNEKGAREGYESWQNPLRNIQKGCLPNNEDDLFYQVYGKKS